MSRSALCTLQIVVMSLIAFIVAATPLVTIANCTSSAPALRAVPIERTSWDPLIHGRGHSAAIETSQAPSAPCTVVRVTKLEAAPIPGTNLPSDAATGTILHYVDPGAVAPTARFHQHLNSIPDPPPEPPPPRP